MKKKVVVFLTLLLAFAMVIPSGLAKVAAADGGAVAAAAPKAKAFIMFADSSWAVSKWNADDADPVVNGDGVYTVSYTSGTPFDGFAFAALGVENGETLFPGATIEIQSIRINGKEVACTKGYTSSDDGVVTRMNIYNEWVSELPSDARSFDGKIDDATPCIINPTQKGTSKIEITFAYHVPTAYIMFADSAWATQYWYDGKAYDGITATNVPITGPGEYTVKVESANPFSTLAFMALGISYGEVAFPAGCIELTSVKINGQDVETKLGYTSSDDGITTRMNIFNEWVSSIPDDARGYGPIADATPQVIGKDVADVTSMEITFKYHIPYTYLMYADSSWAYSYWGDYSKDTQVNGEGNYTVSLALPEGTAFDDLAFLAVGIQDAEKIFPGYCIKLDGIKVNGEKYEVKGKGYTSSDDGITTRMNLYNEWVGAIPVDARSYDKDIEGVSPVIVEKELKAVNKIEVSYQYIAGDVEVVEEEDTFDYEAALKNPDYKAYMAVQTSPNYVFRNNWYENYGLNTEGDYFSHLTGWDAGNVATNNGGKFTDADIKGDGTYTVKLELAAGDAGFANQESYNFLCVSTTIPYKLIDKGLVEITDVKTSFDGGAARAFTFVDSVTDAATKTDYAEIFVLSSYNSDVGSEAIPFLMANESITITFTVKGFGTGAASTGSQSAANATSAPSSGVPVWVWVIVAVAVIAVAAVVVVAAGKKKK